MTKIENKEKIQHVLEEWKGGKATLWGYICSFQRLVLRITLSDVRGNLHLNCTSCSSIKVGKIFWDDIHLVIKEISYDEFIGSKYRITDMAGEFEIICGGFYLECDVDPIY